MGAPAASGGAETPTPAYLDVRGAARRLGVSTSWLYRNHPQIPGAVRLGTRSLRFDVTQLDRWLARRKS